MTKHVTEDWSHFNRAVLARLGYAVVPVGEQPAPAAAGATAPGLASLMSAPGAPVSRAATATGERKGIASTAVELARRMNAPLTNSAPRPPAAPSGEGFRILKGLVGVAIVVGIILMIANVIKHQSGPSLHASVPSYTPRTPVSTMPTPTPTPTPSSATKAASNERRVENYTKFSSVDYRDGSVITGWVYGSNVEEVPRREYCYYLNTDPVTKVDNKFDLQNKGEQANPYPMSPALDLSPAQWQEAHGKCHWSSPSGPTVPTN